LLSASDPDDLNNQLADLIKNPNSHSLIPVSQYQIAEDGTEKISYNNTGNNYLVTTDNYYPDWVGTFASGREEKITDATGLRALDIAPGQGSVTITYKSQSFKLGLEISAAALIILVLLFIFV
jgi:uncharacterized membrane protein YfhO